MLYIAFGDLYKKASKRLDLGLVVVYQSPGVDRAVDIPYSEDQLRYT